jgi:hypothetical protein
MERGNLLPRIIPPCRTFTELHISRGSRDHGATGITGITDVCTSITAYIRAYPHIHMYKPIDKYAGHALVWRVPHARLDQGQVGSEGSR